MKIGVLSDTHGSLVQTKKALDAIGKCDLYIHLGDVLYHGPRNPLFKSYNPQELAIFLRDKEITYIKGNCRRKNRKSKKIRGECAFIRS